MARAPSINIRLSLKERRSERERGLHVHMGEEERDQGRESKFNREREREGGREGEGGREEGREGGREGGRGRERGGRGRERFRDIYVISR